jgi:hypothetical protein
MFLASSLILLGCAFYYRLGWFRTYMFLDSSFILLSCVCYNWLVVPVRLILGSYTLSCVSYYWLMVPYLCSWVLLLYC